MLHICNLYKRGTRINIESEMFIRHIFLSILYIFMTAHSAQAGVEDCEDGYGYMNNACYECGAGLWIPADGSSYCKECPQGYYQGTNMNPRNQPCTKCPAGFTAQNYRQVECDPCEEGEYQNEEGKTYCKGCQAGKSNGDTAQTDQTSCKDCAAGKYATYGSPCTPCDTGEYQNLEGQSSCTACVLGYYHDQTGQTSVDSCKHCEKGTYGKEAGDCENCPAGFFEDLLGSKFCQYCTEGKYNDEEGQTSCKDCETGKFSGVGQSSCTGCPKGKYSDVAITNIGQCKKCAAGKSNGQTDQTSEDSCEECDAGKFSDIDGQSTCKPCAAGKFSEQGQTECTGCPKGKYSDEAITNIGQCKECEKGKYNGQTDKTSCKECEEGKYNDEEGQADCKDCDAGKYSDNDGQTSCKDCDEGKFSEQGQNECEGCPKGKYSDEAITNIGQCKECEKGKYNGQTDQASCKECEEGKYNDDKGQEDCKVCLKGKYNDVKGQEACKDCSNGKYSDETGLTADVQCKDCSKGKYSDQTGSTLCDWCVKGGYQNEEGQTTCKECPSGKTTDNFGAVLQQECEGCPTGYNADAATKTCFTCPRGKIIDGDLCTSCEQGQFSNEPDSQACKNCEGDREYQDEKGQTTCKECPTCYNLAADRKSCKLCEGNTFPKDGDCQSCPSGKFIRRTPGCDENDCAECPGAGKTSCYGEYEHIVFESGTVGDISTAKERCKNAIEYVLGYDVTVEYIDNDGRDYGCGYDLSGGYINNNTGKDSNPSEYKGLCVLKTNATHYAKARGMSCDGMKAGPDRIVRGNRIFGGIQASLDTVITTDVWTPTQPGDNTPSFCQPGYYFKDSACKECPVGWFSDAYVQSGDIIACVKCSAEKYSSAGAMQCTNCPKGSTSETGQDKCVECPDGCPQGTVRSSGPGCACESCKPGTFIGFSFASVGPGKCSSTCKITTTREFTIITEGTCDITVDSPTVCAPDGADLTDILEIRDAPTGCITYAAGERKGKWFFNYLQTNKECSVFSPCRCMTITKTCESATSGTEVSAQECGEQCNTLGQNLFSVDGTQDSWSDNATDYIIDGECAWECNQEQDRGFKDGMKLRLGRADSITECFQRIRQEYPEARGASISNDEECYAHFYVSESILETDTGNQACKFTRRDDCTLRQCLCATESGCSLDDTQMTWHTFRTEGTTGQKGQCTECPEGRYSMGSSDSCIDCPKGRYSNELGTSVPCKPCTTCPVGYRMDTSGQSSTTDCGGIECVECQAGYYQDEKTHDECKACGPNSYQTQAGQSTCSECTSCDGGKTRRTPASTSCSGCESCEIGAFCESGGIEQPCPVGKYNDQVGQITCKDCPAEKSSTVGQAECT